MIVSEIETLSLLFSVTRLLKRATINLFFTSTESVNKNFNQVKDLESLSFI